MMMRTTYILAGALAATLLPTGALAQDKWTVRPEWVRAHESFLASEALQGRGSATRDEAIAAAYVAAQFESFGLKTAPGMPGHLQPAQIVRTRLKGAALTADGATIAAPTVLIGGLEPVSGKTVVFAGTDPATLPKGDVVLTRGDGPGMQLFGIYRAAAANGAKLVIVRESAATQDTLAKFGGTARMPTYLEDGGAGMGGNGPALVVLPAAAFDALAAKPGATVAATFDVEKDVSTTTNAIGYLPGSDPAAGYLLLTAHLDHLGRRPDGTIMPGANDDASGTTAVLELARALASGKPMKRGILFVAYGSEEIGGFGSTYFGKHPPVPLDQIVANIEVEMIGAQDPKLPAGTMMMTGFERSTLGETLKAHGALVTADPYPDQHFFERSDNYSLALRGVVAHTISGWAVTPTYHSPTDTLANLDIAFMTRAIQSLVEPVRSLANSNARPEWKPGGRPAAK
jgi:aminopeptidase YwaD